MQGVLAGRYRLERQLGKGGMGSVWLAEHLALRSWVAVKLMDPAIAATAEGAERFRREAQAAASLRSAHVVQVLDYGVHETTPFLVMELMQGESLAACLEREKRLTPDRTLAIMTQVARALGRAHSAGIVHRDLKPDNIFLVREDDQELVKILDFGIAKTPQAQFGGMETRTGVTMGTPYYMSPEQVEGKKAVDFRTDLWAMAVITSECLTGVRPFDGSTFGELLLNICARPIAPPSSQGFLLRGFDEWFARATNRDAEQRFGSAQDLVNALREVVQGGNPAYAQAATAGPQTHSAGRAPSVSSINTSQSFDAPKPRSALPWLALAFTALAGAVLAAALLLRPKPVSVASEPSASSSSAAAPDPTAAAVLAPAPEATIAIPPSTSKPAPRALNVTVPGSAAAEPPAEPKDAHSTSPPAANPAPAGAATVASAAATGTKALRCFIDPFSGQIRAAPAGRGDTFGCRQDPFTGKYRKL